MLLRLAHRTFTYRQDYDVRHYMNGQTDKEEAAGIVLKALLPFLKADECVRVKGQISDIAKNMKEEHQQNQSRGFHIYTYVIFPFIFLWVVWLLFDVYYGTDIPFHSSDRLLVDLVLIVIVLVLLFYVFSREMCSLNKAIKDIDEFAGKE